MCLPWHWRSYARCWSTPQTLLSVSPCVVRHYRRVDLLPLAFLKLANSPLVFTWVLLPQTGLPYLDIHWSKWISPSKRAFRSSKRTLDLQGEYHGADKDKCLYHWRWTFCTEIAWRCLQMSWFICSRVNRHETSCSSAISHVVVAIGGTLVRLRGRVMAGRVREVDGGWIGCYWSNRCVLIFSFVLIDRNCHVWVCQMILSRCNLERVSEYELKITYTETPDSWSLSQPFPIWSEHWTQINCAANVKWVRMHSSWMSSQLNHWPSLVRTRNNSIAGQDTQEILIETFIDLTSTLLRFHQGE